MPATPEALIIKTYNPAIKSGTTPPNEILTTTAASELLTIFDKDSHVGRWPILIEIQNMAVQPVYYKVNSDAEVDGGIANGVPLAGGSAANDGLGSRVTFDFRRQMINKITLISVTGAIRVTVEKTLQP